MVAHEVDQSPPAARNDQIDQSRGTEQRGRRFVRGRQQGEGVLVEAVRRERAADQRGDRRIGVAGVAAPFEDAGVARLDAEREDVEPHVGTCFVDDADDAEWYRDFADLHAVGAHRAVEDASQRRRKRRHVAQVGGDAQQPPAVEQQRS